MALDVLRAIAREIEQRFGVTRLAIVHRSGEVPLGEASVVVCAASAHRERRVRRRALRHRGAQGARADLEERALRGRIRLDRRAAARRTVRARNLVTMVRVYISVDMEGIAGISHANPTRRGDYGYRGGRGADGRRGERGDRGRVRRWRDRRHGQ